MAKYSKPQLAIVNATGLELDRETGVYFGKIGGYSALLRLLSNQYLMSFSVARNGMQPSAADMQVAVTGCEALQSCNVQGTRVNFYIKSGMTQKKTVENLGTAAGYLQAFFQQNGFMWVATPLITASDCEGAGEMFTVTGFDMNNIPKDDKGQVDFSKDFFGKHAYMTVSGQLNVETYACAFSKVYTFGPTFRAENSNTTRHLAEFWMVEPEMAFTDLNGCAATAEKLLKYVFSVVLKERADDMKFIAERVDKDAITRLENFVNSDFAQVDYTDAIEILKNATKKFEYPVEWGIDLQSEHERYLAEEHFKAPVVVKNYPTDIKAFYMKQNDDGKTVAAMDVLAPGIGEIIGGSQREDSLEKLDKRMDELGLNKDNYWWYRDLRRYGSVPHSGFGLGFERLIVYITGVGNVRDAIPFPRTPRSAEF